MQLCIWQHLITFDFADMIFLFAHLLKIKLDFTPEMMAVKCVDMNWPMLIREELDHDSEVFV
jgi:hypothetical protein